MIYVPFQQDRSGFLRFVAFVARTPTPGSVVEGIRAEIRRAAPDLPIQSAVTMDEAVAASVALARLLAAAPPRRRAGVLALVTAGVLADGWIDRLPLHAACTSAQAMTRVLSMAAMVFEPINEKTWEHWSIVWSGGASDRPPPPCS